MRILWLSDIHLKTCIREREITFDYNGKETFVSNYFEAFEAKVTSEYDKIDFVVITGDLAYNADANAYKLLKEKLKFLEEKKIPILTVPGNHDISWDELTLEYFKQENFLSNRKEKFENNELTPYYNAFKNYSNARFQIQEEGKKDDKNVIISKDFKEKSLNGYYIDKNRKLIFILINSAWFATGPSYQKWLEEKYIKKENQSIEVGKIIELTKLSQDIGNLTTGVNSVFSSEFEDIFTNTDYDDYIKITCMHHPVEWLSWDEINEIDEGTTLFKIISNSNLLLTGHIHPPRYYRGDWLFFNTLHLRAPIFLTHNDDEDTDIKSDIGFAIINIEDKKLGVDYYYYENETKPKTVLNSILFKKNKKYSFIKMEDSLKGFDICKTEKKSIEPLANEEQQEESIKVKSIENSTEKVKNYIKNKLDNDLLDFDDNISDIDIFLSEKNNSACIYLYKMGDSHITDDDFDRVIKSEKIQDYKDISKLVFLKFDSEILANGEMSINKWSKDTSIKTKQALMDLTISYFNKLEDKIGDDDYDSIIEEKVFEKIACSQFIYKVVKSSEVTGC